MLRQLITYMVVLALGCAARAQTVPFSPFTNSCTASSGGVATSGDSATGFFDTGTIEAARLGSGTANSTTYLRGDQTWATVGGGVTAPTAITSASSPYTVLSGDADIYCNATSGAVTINLPAATGTGRKLSVIKVDGSTNNCTIARAGSDTIDGQTSLVLYVQYMGESLQDRASASWHAEFEIKAAKSLLIGTSAAGYRITGTTTAKFRSYLDGSWFAIEGGNLLAYEPTASTPGVAILPQYSILTLLPSYVIGWPASTTDAFNFPDTGLSKCATAGVCVGNGTDDNTDAYVKAREFLAGGTASPSLSGSCGTGAAFVDGSKDAAMQIVPGTGSPTSCVATFGSAKAKAPPCVANATITTTPLNVVTTTTTVTVSSAALTTGEVLHVVCLGF